MRLSVLIVIGLLRPDHWHRNGSREDLLGGAGGSSPVLVFQGGGSLRAAQAYCARER
jgi:hypothetical protein